MSVKLPINTRLGPGPGFLPLVSSVLLGVIAISMVREATLPSEPDLEEDDALPVTGAARLQMVAVLALIVIAGLTLEEVGFRVIMFGFCVLALIVLGERNPILIGLIALGGSAGVYHALAVWLRVPLPVGSIGF
jgi:hypothetical protein